MFFFLMIHCGYPTNTHQVSWKIVFKKKQPWFLHHVKPLGVDFTRIGYAFGSTSRGPYYHKAHPLGFYCTLIVLIQSTKKEMTKWKPSPIS
jgi:hypothetical protein